MISGVNLCGSLSIACWLILMDMKPVMHGQLRLCSLAVDMADLIQLWRLGPRWRKPLCSLH